MTYLLIVIGFALLLFGGEIVVRASVSLSERLGVSPMIVGLTVIGFGTSLPELVVNVNAALSGSTGLAIGNVVGSNIANTMLVVGVAAAIQPLVVAPELMRRDTTAMMAATLVFIGIGLLTSRIEWWHGVLMVIALCTYLVLTVREDANARSMIVKPPPGEPPTADRRPPGIDIALAIAGLTGVIVGAEWLVTGATSMAEQLGVPDEIIGLTVIAIGTSLPELATAIVAALRGHSDVALGNVVGSNIFNLFGVAGITALFAPLPFPANILQLDLWVLLGTAALLMLVMLTGRRISRIEGVVLAVLYCVYIAAQFTGFNGVS